MHTQGSKSNPGYGGGAPLRWIRAATAIVEQSLTPPVVWQRARLVAMTAPPRTQRI